MAIGKPVAFDASAEERDTRGFISMTMSRPSAGLTANCTFEPPVSTPISRSTASEASRIIWYSLSVSVSAGAWRSSRRYGPHRVDVLDRAYDDAIVFFHRVPSFRSCIESSNRPTVPPARSRGARPRRLRRSARADTIGSSRLYSLAAISEVASYLGAADHAPNLYDALSPFADRLAVIHPGLTVVAPIDQPLGQLSVLMGDRDRSEQHFEMAISRAPISARSPSAPSGDRRRGGAARIRRCAFTSRARGLLLHAADIRRSRRARPGPVGCSSDSGFEESSRCTS